MVAPLIEPMPREWFEDWREPGEFHRAAHKGLLFLYGQDNKFSPPQYLCDAYHAGCFSRIWRDDQGPCTVRLVHETAEPPDAEVQAAHMQKIELEITMALDQNSRLLLDLHQLKGARFPKSVTGEELDRSAREAIPRAVKHKAEKYGDAQNLTLLVIGGAGLSCEEMAHLTEPWKNCFHAICLLSMMDVVIAWPKLRVLRGKERF